MHSAIQGSGSHRTSGRQAATAQSEAEAEVSLATALPITISIMGARQPLRRVMPVLTQANARLVQAMHRQGPGGRQLLRRGPPIQRRTIPTLGKMAQRGQPISAPLAVKTMAAVTNRCFEQSATGFQFHSSAMLLLRARTAPGYAKAAIVYSPRGGSHQSSNEFVEQCVDIYGALTQQ